MLPYFMLICLNPLTSYIIAVIFRKNLEGRSEVDNLAGIFISAFAVAFSGAVVPGPVLSVTISESAKGNLWAGPMIITGHALLEIVLILLLVAGFADFINNAKFLGVVSALGGFYLLFTACCMLKNIKYAAVKSCGEDNLWRGPVLTGVLTSLANPYWIIWWATIGLGYVIISMRLGPLGILIFFIGHILADFSWYSMVSLMVSRGRRFMSDKIYRVIIASCAFMLIFFGMTFSTLGVKQLTNFAG